MRENPMREMRESPMIIGIPKEILDRERRVAATPETVKKLLKRGLVVLVQSGAGVESGYADATYAAAGARVVASAAELFAEADLILKVRPPRPEEVAALKPGAVLVGFIWPAQNRELLELLVAKGGTALAMDAVPRITRAQRMDALSAMANIAGYRAVLEAANHFDRFFPGQITAAGRARPAQVLVLGAGVAGLAAIAAARGLGAVVKAFDTRSVVREQVESLGAAFVEFTFAEEGEGQGGYAKEMSPAYLAAEQALIASHAKQSDIVISTALIPGKPAPQLITAAAIGEMQPGSVVVDMAAEQGGNCPLTERDRVVVKNGITLIGYTDLPSRMARQSSDLYATTVFNLVDSLFDAQNAFRLDPDDEIHVGATVVRAGVLSWPPKPRPKPATVTATPASPSAAAGPGLAAAATSDRNPLNGSGKVATTGVVMQAVPSPTPGTAASPSGGGGKPHAQGQGGAKGGSGGRKPGIGGRLAMIGLVVIFGLAAIFGPPEFLGHLTVFLLACVVGYHVIWNVSPALHTPLMSVTNAISGIILVGGMVVLGSGAGLLADVLAAVAILLAAINVAGGFLVTQRMLRMFRR
jgi:NAD(P) transhydrogenase subunit alpha